MVVLKSVISAYSASSW